MSWQAAFAACQHFYRLVTLRQISLHIAQISSLACIFVMHLIRRKAKVPEENISKQPDEPVFQETKLHATVDSSFAHSQLIGGEHFMRSYKSQLLELNQSSEFGNYISELREELNGTELTDTKMANRRIADSFFHSNINGRFPAAEYITTEVKKNGKQASAHISIYYAMYILDYENSQSE